MEASEVEKLTNLLAIIGLTHLWSSFLEKKVVFDFMGMSLIIFFIMNMSFRSRWD